MIKKTKSFSVQRLPIFIFLSILSVLLSCQEPTTIITTKGEPIPISTPHLEPISSSTYPIPLSLPSPSSPQSETKVMQPHVSTIESRLYDPTKKGLFHIYQGGVGRECSRYSSFLHIRGHGFDTASIQIGPAICKNYYEREDEILCEVSTESLLGTFDIQVTNLNGKSFTLPASFTFLEANDINPFVAPTKADTGSTVTLEFSSVEIPLNANILIGTKHCSDLQRNESSRGVVCTIHIPKEPAEDLPIQIRFPTGTSKVLAQKFTFRLPGPLRSDERRKIREEEEARLPKVDAKKDKTQDELIADSYLPALFALENRYPRAISEATESYIEILEMVKNFDCNSGSGLPSFRKEAALSYLNKPRVKQCLKAGGQNQSHCIYDPFGTSKKYALTELQVLSLIWKGTHDQRLSKNHMDLQDRNRRLIQALADIQGSYDDDTEDKVINFDPSLYPSSPSRGHTWAVFRALIEQLNNEALDRGASLIQFPLKETTIDVSHQTTQDTFHSAASIVTP